MWKTRQCINILLFNFSETNGDTSALYLEMPFSGIPENTALKLYSAHCLGFNSVVFGDMRQGKKKLYYFLECLCLSKPHLKIYSYCASIKT